MPAEKIPGELLKIIINRMAFEGYLLRIGSSNIRSNLIQYVATETWIGRNLTGYDPQKALEELAIAYFHAFGPARIKDFQWWSGVTITKAKKAISSIETVDIGDGYLLLSKDFNEFDHFQPAEDEHIDLLPQWDSYIMGYAPDGRERFVSRDKQDNIYGKIGATGGNGLGTILINGMALGSWSAKFKGSQMTVQLNLFNKPSGTLENSIRENFKNMSLFLEMKKMTIDE